MDGRTNRETEMTLLIVTFHNIVDASKCVTTLEDLGIPSVKIPLCTNPSISALGYTFPVIFYIIYMANVELLVTVRWIDGHDGEKVLKFLPTVNVYIIKGKGIAIPLQA
jgi:hypothetical protein